MDDYLARKALSAGMAWAMVSECPAQAWHSSPWNPDYVDRQSADFDIGKVMHLTVLENHLIADRVTLIDAKDWRTDRARQLRDEAYIEGKTPLLPKHWEQIVTMRRRLEDSPAAELLFGEGLNEHEYYWEWSTPFSANPRPGDMRVPCKAKADRIVFPKRHVIVDLKTAPYASPEVFSRAVIRDGHHLRAAWYLDGWAASQEFTLAKFPAETADYLYVVIAKEEPHLVSIFRLDEGAIEKGRWLYRRALSIFRRCQETGIWPGYAGAEAEKIQNISLPAWYQNLLEARVRAGEFDDERGEFGP